MNISPIEQIRQAGVRRGIQACIAKLEEIRERHSRRSSGYNDLTIAIEALRRITVEEAEEI